MRLHDGPQGAAPTSPIARGLSFVELMELLEFSRLRFEAPAAGASATLIGTQEWHLGIDADGLPLRHLYLLDAGSLARCRVAAGGRGAADRHAVARLHPPHGHGARGQPRCPSRACAWTCRR